jgi:hypothetical protein
MISTKQICHKSFVTSLHIYCIDGVVESVSRPLIVLVMRSITIWVD